MWLICGVDNINAYTQIQERKKNIEAKNRRDSTINLVTQQWSNLCNIFDAVFHVKISCLIRSIAKAQYKLAISD